MSDFCGIIGPVPTNPVIPITGQLSTASYDYKLGEVWQGEGQGRSGTTKRLDFADFANPTWGLSNEFVTSYIDSFNNRPAVRKVRTIGPPFNPIVVPPPELLSYEPAWSVCSTFGGQSGGVGGNYYNAPLSYGIFDPPRTLSAGGALGPPAVPSSPLPVISTPTSGPDPLPPKNDPTPATQPAPPTPKPTAPVDHPQSSQGSQQSAPGNVQPTPGNPQQSAAGNSQQPTPENPPQSASGTPQPGPGNSQQSAARNSQQPTPGNPPQSASGTPQPGPGNSQQAPSGNAGLGAIIISGFGPVPTQGSSASKITISIAPPAQPNPVVTAGGQQVTVLNPSVIAVGGTVVSANGPAATVGGQAISLDPNRGVVVGHVNGGGNGEGNGGGNGGSNGGGNGSGSPAAPVPLPPVGQANPVITAGNSQLLTVINPSAVAIGGIVLSAHGSAATIGGQVFSLDLSAGVVVGATPSGAAPVIVGNTAIVNPSNVVVAGSTLTPGGPGISMITPAPTAIPSVYTVGGQAFTANANGFSIAGTSLTPGASAITISGTVVSLETGGTLDMGTSKILLGQSSIFTVGSQVFTANPSGFSIGGTTLTPGGPAVTISGTVVSLESGGTLDIGTSKISLATGTGPLAFQGRGGRVEVSGLMFSMVGIMIAGIGGGLFWM